MMKKTLTTLGLLVLASCQQQPAAAPPPPPPPPPPVAPGPVAATPPPAPVAPAVPPATGEERAKLFHDCWAAYSAKDWAKFGPCYTEHATSEEVDSGKPVVSGRAEIVKHAEGQAAQAPDEVGELELVLVNGNNMAAVALLKGTNTGPLVTPGGELPPTKKKFGFLAGHAVDLSDDGRAAAHDRFYADGGTFMGQVGLAKGPHRKVLDKGWAEKPVVVATGSDVEKANLAAAPKALEAFNKHDLPALVAMMTDDVVFSEAASPLDRVGKKAIERSYKDMFKAFSDLKLEITRSWAAGDYLVWEGSMTGTNDGAMPSMAIYKPTGKKVSSRFLEIDKIQGGKIKNIWIFDNGMSFAGQLGLLPPPPAPKPAPAAAAAKPGAAPAAAAATPATAGKPAPAAGAAPAAAKPAAAPAPAAAAPAMKPAAAPAAPAATPAKPVAPAAPAAPAPAAPAPKPAPPAPAPK
ncbi:MAG TPA: nuclear transport factor 2 family protein [Polyangiaceae bacterium]|nr:nuclear transport factor 2 family protein [Polyangiaceae bacterium]